MDGRALVRRDLVEGQDRARVGADDEGAAGHDLGHVRREPWQGDGLGGGHGRRSRSQQDQGASPAAFGESLGHQAAKAVPDEDGLAGQGGEHRCGVVHIAVEPQASRSLGADSVSPNFWNCSIGSHTSKTWMFPPASVAQWKMRPGTEPKPAPACSSCLTASS